MTLIIDCPSCQRKLRVPDDLLGLKVKCPSCATMFTAVDTNPAPLPPPPMSEPIAAPALETGSAPPWPSEPAVPPPLLEPAPPLGLPEPAAQQPGLSEPAAPQLGLSEPGLPPLGLPEPAAPLLRPPPVPRDDHRPCPSCRESIPIEATRCRYCGQPVDRDPDEDRPWERPYRSHVRRDTEPHRGTLVLVFGILSIVLGMTWIVSVVALPMGIAAWVMGHRDLRRMRMNEMDPQGEGSTQAGWICGIVGTVLSSFMTLMCLGCAGMMVMPALFSGARTTNRPTGGPAPKRFSAPAENPPLRVPVWPRIG